MNHIYIKNAKHKYKKIVNYIIYNNTKLQYDDVETIKELCRLWKNNEDKSPKYYEKIRDCSTTLKFNDIKLIEMWSLYMKHLNLIR